MSSPFVYYFIHHSHTDIGYTDPQDKIEKYHVYYIRRAVDILNAAHSSKPEWLGFRWNCESYRFVEKFLEQSSERYRNDFIRFVKSEEIGLSGSYVNLTELVDGNTLSETEAAIRRQMTELGVTARSAMACDVNGFAWGFADALYENGFTRLLTAINSHHGGCPLGRRQHAFYWVSPKGNRVLTWIGEHYNLGNELGITGQPSFEHVIRDGLNETEPDPFRRAEKRLEKYRDKLLSEGYPYGLVPVNVSGTMADNAPPNPYIAEFCNKYNSIHRDIILKTATLDDFFDALEKTGTDIPEYRGDFTDWWADGVGSTPADVKLFRKAVRKLDALRVLDPEHKFCSRYEEARENLIMYAEHTWGYFSSGSRPFEPEVSELEKRKSLYALNAYRTASEALEDLTFATGETPLNIGGRCSLAVINPSRREQRGTARIPLRKLPPYGGFRVTCSETGTDVPCQTVMYPAGPELVLDLRIRPAQTVHCLVEESGENGWQEYAGNACPGLIDTPFLRVTVDREKGITSLLDKEKGLELVKTDATYPPFTPVYEVTPTGGDPYGTRVAMGRQRKTPGTMRSAGKITDVNITDDGPLITRATIVYSLDGAEYCDVTLTFYRNSARIDVDLRLHKKSVRDPENLYLSLPFTAGKDEELWIEKTSSVLRPRIDQIPGTCTDFYLVQSGAAFVSPSHGSTVIATPDTPLIAMCGPEAYEPALSRERKNSDDLYAWVMNNFWETNFKAELGDFYQFRYSIVSTDDKNPHDAIESARNACQDFIVFTEFS